MNKEHLFILILCACGGTDLENILPFSFHFSPSILSHTHIGTCTRTHVPMSVNFPDLLYFTHCYFNLDYSWQANRQPCS